MAESQCCSSGTRIRTASITAGRAALLGTWYGIVVAPDAQTFLHRAINSRKGSLPLRIWDGTRSLLQFASLPVAVASTAVGRTRLARVASLSVFVNPPTVLITALIVHDVAHTLFGVFRRALGGVSRLIASDTAVGNSESGAEPNTTIGSAPVASANTTEMSPAVVNDPSVPPAGTGTDGSTA